uniref:Uncharacterized protein n=1 Tax=Oryza brachyantha TaxID=4533 RepID=J3MKV6_ORYBR
MKIDGYSHRFYDGDKKFTMMTNSLQIVRSASGPARESVYRSIKWVTCKIVLSGRLARKQELWCHRNSRSRHNTLIEAIENGLNIDENSLGVNNVQGNGDENDMITQELQVPWGAQMDIRGQGEKYDERSLDERLCFTNGDRGIITRSGVPLQGGVNSVWPERMHLGHHSKIANLLCIAFYCAVHQKNVNDDK